LAKDLAPPGAASTVRTFLQHQNPFGEDLLQKVSGYRADQAVRFQLFPGCTTLVKRPELIDQLMAVGDAVGASMGIAKASGRCCGYPLYAAGAMDELKKHAQRMAESLNPFPELVVLDPGCAFTLKEVYQRVGVKLHTQIRTVYEVLLARLDHLSPREPMDAVVAYQDACHLGRGLGQYEPPRALLRAAVREVKEAFEAREEGGCSGGGGLLPRTMSEAAVRIARRQADRVAPGGETIVTACPTSRRMFERAGRSAEDLISVLHRWILGEGR
jgi:Fe-S oxidoreductase